LKTEVHYDNKVIVSDMAIRLGSCDKEEILQNQEKNQENKIINMISNKDKIGLGSVIEDVSNDEEYENTNLFRALFSIILVIFLGVAGIILYNFGHN
jgi:histidyl-tRNA synthetase